MKSSYYPRACFTMDKLTRVVDNLVMAHASDSASAVQPPANGRATTEADSAGVGRETFFRYLPVSQRDRKWGLYVTSAGVSRIGPHSPYPPIPHPQSYHYTPAQRRVLQEYQMTYISRGSGALHTAVAGKQRIEAGQLYVLFPGIWHREIPDPENGWNEHWLGFDGPVARGALGPPFFSPRRPVIKVRDEQGLLELYTQAIAAVKANQPALQQILAGVVLYALGLVYSAQHFQAGGDDRSMAFMHSAINMMRENLTTPMDLEDLAHQLGLSYTSFRHKFAHHTGMSPHQYLLESRLARARNLLASTTLSTKEIAHQSGFEDEHYFCRLFHKKIGTTPTEWRTRTHNRGRKLKR